VESGIPQAESAGSNACGRAKELAREANIPNLGKKRREPKGAGREASLPAPFLARRVLGRVPKDAKSR